MYIYIAYVCVCVTYAFKGIPDFQAAVKEERREARRMKKEMKGLYRCEAQRAQKVAAVSGPSSIHLM